ncbi:hypothetical protein O3Q52_51735 [Streptomyces sp. ActVer]|uniref:hypothetical protein n=1 Tax=Streptomyces sp. ActVer TaxID=3014558 RepID=UPI0022B2BEF7|nr:hypothetical protein [Streptomyces sp. ActVer]MCZ4516442.1 hypothetical protein [Streptomyces sp. ActVer]
MSDRTAFVLLASALAVIVASMVAVAAGCLARLDQATFPVALIQAAKAFAAALAAALVAVARQ